MLDQNLTTRLNSLAEAVNHPETPTNDIYQDACIRRFNLLTDLYWHVLKKVLAYEKIESSTPRDVMSKAYQFGLIDDEDMWLRMLDDRNNTSHVYRQEDARRVYSNVAEYLVVCESTYIKLKTRYGLK